MSSDPPLLPGEFVATIGVFDGVHRGHLAILAPMVARARRGGVPAVLFTFHPRPVTVFAPGTPPDELTPAPRKWRLLAEVGVERIIVLRFSRTFAKIEPERFLNRVLGLGDGLRAVWVGHDFRFGHRRRGDFEMLSTVAARHGVRAHRIEALHLDGAPVSSTRIRERIRAGAVGEAARLLGRWPDLEGEVVRGRGEGGRLLVRTANLALPETQCLPATGVYAGEAEWEGTDLPAVLNLGYRPTLTSGRVLVAEVHILDFEGDLIGRRLLFRLRHRLRGERNFPTVNQLRAQIEEDIESTRREARGWGTEETNLASGTDSC